MNARLRSRSRFALLAAGALFCTSLPAVAADAFKPSVEAEVLSDRLVLLRMIDDARGHVNALLSHGPDGLLLVDHAGDWQKMECAPEAAKVFEKAIRSYGNGKVRYVINTHWHGDHTAGNEIYGKEAVIVAHANARKRLMTRQTPWWFPDGLRALEPHGWPGVTFDNTLTLHVNGEDVRLMHFGEAHTDGDAIVYFAESRVAHFGDMYLGFDALAMMNDAEGLLLALQGASSRLPRDVRIVTGHAGITDLAEMRRFQSMLGATISSVRSQIKEGRSVEQIKAAGLPKPWNTQWTGDAAQVPVWLETIHRSLAEHRGEGG